MKNGLVVADSGPILSLCLIDKLWILDQLFDKVTIPDAVWKELTFDKNKNFVSEVEVYFKDKVQKLQIENNLDLLMDRGESESVLLYKETNADFLLIDDLKARKIAESMSVNCIGTLGVLSAAKEKGTIDNLKPLFEKLISGNRYYGREVLNKILSFHHEAEL